MKFKKMMLGLNLAILPIVSITTVISCNNDDKTKDKDNISEVAKTTIDLQTSIADKANEIRNALIGKTSELKLETIKSVLKTKIADSKFNDLIDSLTLKPGAVDGMVTIISGSTEITIATSTTTSKTIADLQTAIANKANEIRGALIGETSELKLETIKSVLKTKIADSKFNDLIDSLTLKELPIDGKVVVTSTLIDITISTSTITPILVANLEAAIEVKSNQIADALNGETNKMTIEKIRAVLKKILDDTYNSLIDGLVLDSKEDESIVVKSGKTEIIIVTSTTTTPAEKSVQDLRDYLRNNYKKIMAVMTGDTNQMDIYYVKMLLNNNIDKSYKNLIDKMVLVGKPEDGMIVVKIGEEKIKILTTTKHPKTIADLKSAINANEKIKSMLKKDFKTLDIDKIKEILKSNLDDSYDDVINALIWYGKRNGVFNLGYVLGDVNVDVDINTSNVTTPAT